MSRDGRDTWGGGAPGSFADGHVHAWVNSTGKARKYGPVRSNDLAQSPNRMRTQAGVPVLGTEARYMRNAEFDRLSPPNLGVEARLGPYNAPTTLAAHARRVGRLHARAKGLELGPAVKLSYQYKNVAIPSHTYSPEYCYRYPVGKCRINVRAGFKPLTPTPAVWREPRRPEDLNNHQLRAPQRSRLV